MRGSVWLVAVVAGAVLTLIALVAWLVHLLGGPHHHLSNAIPGLAVVGLLVLLVASFMAYRRVDEQLQAATMTHVHVGPVLGPNVIAVLKPLAVKGRMMRARVPEGPIGGPNSDFLREVDTWEAEISAALSGYPTFQAEFMADPPLGVFPFANARLAARLDQRLKALDALLET